MADFTLDRGRGQCPKCGHPRFSGPPEPRLSDIISCRDCHERFTVHDAVQAGRIAGGIKQLGPEEPFK